MNSATLSNISLIQVEKQRTLNSDLPLLTAHVGKPHLNTFNVTSHPFVI